MLLSLLMLSSSLILVLSSCLVVSDAMLIMLSRHVVAGSGVVDVRLRRYHSLCSCPRVCPSSGLIFLLTLAGCWNLPQKGLRPNLGEFILSFSSFVVPPNQN